MSMFIIIILLDKHYKTMFNIRYYMCVTLFYWLSVVQHASFDSTWLSHSQHSCYILPYLSICIYQILARVRGNLRAGCVYIDENG